MKNFGKFFGSTTIGKKGQVVIPMETRKEMSWADGDKLLVFGLDNGMVVLTKLDQVKDLAVRLEEKVKAVKQYIKKAK
ncbi:MAG: AbrB/MazE/SpoVT family DNA-binding domain-containing protein [Candidatus Falkowbacteria bacterium]